MYSESDTEDYDATDISDTSTFYESDSDLEEEISKLRLEEELVTLSDTEEHISKANYKVYESKFGRWKPYPERGTFEDFIDDTNFKKCNFAAPENANESYFWSLFLPDDLLEK